ncbi:MAG: hypothetical protein JXB17_11725 [Bacteroidales bacterium]|nr:hypothetical protein [Bacteroidales bacterium]
MMNPLRLVDPKGMSAEDIYEMDNDGHITKKCDLPGPDVLYKKGDNKNFIIIDDDKLLHNLSEITQKKDGNVVLFEGRYAETGNKEDAFKVFKWAADNSNAEWTISGFNITGKEKYVIGTNHDPEGAYPATALGKLFYSQINNTFKMHSHKGSESHYASGGPESNQIGDMDRIKNDAPHYVYDVTNSNTFQYNKTNPSFNVKPVQNSTDIYRNIGR